MSFHHVALNTSDINKSAEFYKKAFGLKQYERWEYGDKKIIMLLIPGGGFLELHSTKKAPSEEGRFWHISFSPENIDECYYHAIECGAKPDRPPYDTVIRASEKEIPVRIAWLTGTDNEPIELFCEKVTTAKL